MRYIVAVALALAAGACGRPPLPEGAVELDATRATKALLKFWNVEEMRRPTVYGVTPNCTTRPDQPPRGFIEPVTGDCIGGFSEWDYNEIYLAMPEGATLLYALPHEMAHLIHWQVDDHSHTKTHIWGPLGPGGMGDESAGFVFEGREHLRKLGPAIYNMQPAGYVTRSTEPLTPSPEY